MYLILNTENNSFVIRDSIDGMAFGKDESIEIHGDNRRGKVYEKPAGVAMKSILSESAILADFQVARTAVVEGMAEVL
jgi:hypothetical protein